jgi:hypothetical protein
MGSNNFNRLLSHYLLEILELYQGNDSPGIKGYCQALIELLNSAMDFIPVNFSKENVEIELNQNFLPGGPGGAVFTKSAPPDEELMPMIRIWDGKAKIYGYIDVLKPITNKKDIDAYSLIALYKCVFTNLILTNFFEFRYYRAGKKVCTARPFSLSHINGIKNNVKVASTKLFLKELQHFMGNDEKKARDSSFINLQQRLALKTYYLREYVLFPVMNHLIVSGSKCELVRIYRAYCYFFDLELSVREFSAFLAHVIIDGYLRAGIFYSRFNYINENHFSRVRVKEFANLSGMKDRRLALFKYLSSKDDQLPVAVKWMLDDISWLIAGFDFKQMGFDDNKKPWLIDGDMLQWQDYFFKPYYENEEYKGVLELLKKAGIFSSEVKSPIQNDKVKRII